MFEVNGRAAVPVLSPRTGSGSRVLVGCAVGGRLVVSWLIAEAAGALLGAGFFGDRQSRRAVLSDALVLAAAG